MLSGTDLVAHHGMNLVITVTPMNLVIAASLRESSHYRDTRESSSYRDTRESSVVPADNLLFYMFYVYSVKPWKLSYKANEKPVRKRETGKKNILKREW